MKQKKKKTFFYLSYNSHFSRTKTSILTDLNCIIIFSNFCYLMKCNTSTLAKNGLKQTFQANLEVLEVMFSKEYEDNSISVNVFQQVKGCKEKNSFKIIALVDSHITLDCETTYIDISQNKSFLRKAVNIKCLKLNSFK